MMEQIRSLIQEQTSQVVKLDEKLERENEQVDNSEQISNLENAIIYCLQRLRYRLGEADENAASCV